MAAVPTQRSHPNTVSEAESDPACWCSLPPLLAEQFASLANFSFAPTAVTRAAPKLTFGGALSGSAQELCRRLFQDLAGPVQAILAFHSNRQLFTRGPHCRFTQQAS